MEADEELKREPLLCHLRLDLHPTFMEIYTTMENTRWGAAIDTGHVRWVIE